MSVLSRRLGLFAGGFSFATIAFFSIGLYVTTPNTKGEVEFLFAGLVLVCLFASFFLWLAHGFAWAMIPEKPAEAKKPAEELKPAEAMRPAEVLKAVEEIKPAQPMKPTEPVKPAEEMKPAEAKRPAEEMKPAEEKAIVSEDPPDAKYTITGKRIY
jgi:outer membrane biosynthesis protein TonB